MNKILGKLLRKAGIHIGSRKEYESLLQECQRGNEHLKLLPQLDSKHVNSAKSQFGQDIVALLASKIQRKGYFVEFGATDGRRYSNTHWLEKKFDWNGIVAEPLPSWHRKLNRNRNCIIDKRCVWSSTGTVIEFLDVHNRELSTARQYADSDNYYNARMDSNVINVETVSLRDLLAFHKAPKVIDYMSIDTEGSEFDILKNFPFHEYQFNFMSVEHNFTPNRQKIRDLLWKNGYKPILDKISECDDWFAPRWLA